MYSRRNTAILAALAVVLLVFTAFRMGQPSGGVNDPFQVGRQSGVLGEHPELINAPVGMFGCIKLCPPSGWFWAPQQSAVLVSGTASSNNQQLDGLSWEVIGEFDGEWHELTAGSASGNSSSRGSPELISFVSMSVPPSSITFRYGIRPGYLMTLWNPHSPSARQIEIRYDTGEVIQRPLAVSITGETVPSGVVTRARAVCSLRLFDAGGVLLQQIDASNDALLASQIQQNAPGACQE